MMEIIEMFYDQHVVVRKLKDIPSFNAYYAK